MIDDLIVHLPRLQEANKVATVIAGNERGVV